MANRKLNGYYRKAYQDFTGGINDHDAAITIPSKQFVQCDNALLNDRNLLEKCKGYTVDGSPFPATSDSFIRMMVNYKRGTSVDKLVVAASDAGNTDATYKVDLKETQGDGTYSYFGYTTGTATFTNGSTAVVGSSTVWATNLKAGDKIKPNAYSNWYTVQSITDNTHLTLTANYTDTTVTGGAYMARIILHKDFVPVAIPFNNNLVISNGSETMMTYNNTSMSLIQDTDAPKAQFLVKHKSRVFGLRTAAHPSGMYWSAVDDETTWDPVSYEPIYENDNGNITGGVSFADSLIILKDNGTVFQVIGNFDQDAAGSPTFIRRIDVPDNIGAIAGRTAVVHSNNNLYFLSETGIYTIDPSMRVTKVSWDIQPDVLGLTIKSSLVSYKAYTFDTQSQWNLGANTDGRVGTDGSWGNFCDAFTLADINTSYPAYAVKLDSSNNVHLVYYTSSNLLAYKKYIATDNSLSINETITPSGNVSALAISIAPDARLGVIYGYRTSGSVGTYKYTERVSGSWSAEETVDTGRAVLGGLDMAYNAASDPSCSYADVLNGAGRATQAAYSYKSSGVWSRTTVHGGVDFTSTNRTSLVMISDNPNVLFAVASEIYGYRSSDGGATFALIGAGGAPYNDPPAPFKMSFQGAVNESNQLVCGFQTYDSPNKSIKTYNYDTATLSSAIAGTSSAQFVGYARYNSKNYLYCPYYNSSAVTLTEDYLYEDSSFLLNSSSTISSDFTYSNNQAQIFANNGGVFASAYVGSSAGTLFIRRISFTATWVSPTESDATLTAWGTYDVSQTTNSGTVTHQVALSTTSTIGTYNTIVPGSVISTDATKIFISIKITSVLGAYAIPSVASAIANFVGTGVDASIPQGYVFNNELYLACADSGQTNNNRIIFLDHGNAWINRTFAVTTFARYKNKLYAGSATVGKVYTLDQGYNANNSAYTLTAITKDDLLGSMELTKDIYKVYVLYEIKSTGTFTFSYRLDNFTSVSGSTWTDTTVDQTTGGLAEVDVKQTAKSIQFKVSNAKLDEQVSIIGFVVLYGYLDVR